MKGHSSILRSAVKQPLDFRKRQSLFFNPIIQPKLTINQPNDVYEQEADAMSDRVMRMKDDENMQQPFFSPAILSVQRKCEHCEEEEAKVQRKESNTEVTEDQSTEDYISSLSGGRALNNNE